MKYLLSLLLVVMMFLGCDIMTPSNRSNSADDLTVKNVKTPKYLIKADYTYQMEELNVSINKSIVLFEELNNTITESKTLSLINIKEYHNLYNTLTDVNSIINSHHEDINNSKI